MCFKFADLLWWVNTYCHFYSFKTKKLQSDLCKAFNFSTLGLLMYKVNNWIRGRFLTLNENSKIG